MLRFKLYQILHFQLQRMLSHKSTSLKRSKMKLRYVHCALEIVRYVRCTLKIEIEL